MNRVHYRYLVLILSIHCKHANIYQIYYTYMRIFKFKDSICYMVLFVYRKQLDLPSGSILAYLDDFQ